MGLSLGIGLAGAQFVGGAAEVAPTLSAVNFTAGGSGTADSVTLTYAGDIAGFRAYIATGTDPLTVSAAQLYDGAGGTNTLQFANFAIAESVTITGLTATSNSATRIAVALIRESDGGLASDVVVATVSGLDFTAPAFSSAEVGNINADTVRVTWDSALHGTVSHTSFSLTGNTFTAASFTAGNTYVDLTLGTTATGSDDYTGDLSYTGTGLVDAKGNTAPTFTGQDVDNNLAVDVAPVFQAAGAVSESTTNTTAAWPTHAVGDVGLLHAMIQVGTGAGFLSSALTSAGYTILENRLVDTTLDWRHVLAWKRAASTSEAAAALNEDGTDGFTRIYARILTFRGCVDSGTPCTVIGSQEQASSSSVAFVDGSTSGANRLVVGAMSIQIDAAGDQLTAGFTNAGLSSLVNTTEISTAGNAGLGLYGFAGTKATAGAVGTTTGTLTAAAIMAQTLIEFIGKPA